MPVVFVVLDAFPFDAVDPDLTPTLAALATEGAWQPLGGIGEMTAATYPNHATLVTGSATVEHGIVTNRVLVDGEWVKSSKTGPATTTLFQRCRAAGLGSVAIVGDQELIGVCGAREADVHWPPDGVVPDGTAKGIGGYIADREVVAAATALDLASHDFVFIQIDEVDSVRHHYGAQSDEAREQCRLTDAALDEVLAAFRSLWNDTVVIVVSDHDQEDYSNAAPIDLAAALPDGVLVENQGTAAQVVGPVDEVDLLSIPGVTGATALAPEIHVVWGADGQRFGTGAAMARADHGSPRTRRQLAVVGGGHPHVGALASWVAGSRPQAADWADRVAGLLRL